MFFAWPLRAIGRGRSLLLPPWEYQTGISIENPIGILVVAGANSCHGLPFRGFRGKIQGLSPANRREALYNIRIYVLLLSHDHEDFSITIIIDAQLNHIPSFRNIRNIQLMDGGALSYLEVVLQQGLSHKVHE